MTSAAWISPNPLGERGRDLQGLGERKAVHRARALQRLTADVVEDEDRPVPDELELERADDVRAGEAARDLVLPPVARDLFRRQAIRLRHLEDHGRAVAPAAGAPDERARALVELLDELEAGDGGQRRFARAAPRRGPRRGHALPELPRDPQLTRAGFGHALVVPQFNGNSIGPTRCLAVIGPWEATIRPAMLEP
ncbi:MAG: hypothetical protein QM820_44880 [Minicystis sp.]